MRPLVMIVSLMLASVIQAVLPAWSYMGQAKAPLLLGVVLYFTLQRSLGGALTLAILGGILHDSLCMVPIGFTSFAFVVAVLVINPQKDKIFGEGLVTQFFLGGVSALGISLLLYFMLVTSGQLRISFGSALIKSIGSGILGIIAVPIVFGLVERLDRFVGNTRGMEI